MNKRNPSLFLMAGFLTIGVIPGWDKGNIMLRQWETLFCLSLSVAARGAGTGSDWSATAGVAA